MQTPSQAVTGPTVTQDDVEAAKDRADQVRTDRDAAVQRVAREQAKVDATQQTVNSVRQAGRRRRSTVDTVVDFFRNQLGTKSDAELRAELVKLIAVEYYRILRRADYNLNGQEQAAAAYGAVEDAARGIDVIIHNHWNYRGRLDGREVVTRGSMNVEVSPALLQELDALIEAGVIDACYKFGIYGTEMPGFRHDSITIYFLSAPSADALNQLAAIAQRHFRGNNLLGRKICEGFYMSEIGSIRRQQIEAMLVELANLDTALAAQIRNYLQLAMSEAQFYALQNAMRHAGIDMTFDQTSGFTLSSTTAQPGAAPTTSPALQVAEAALTQARAGFAAAQEGLQAADAELLQANADLAQARRKFAGMGNAIQHHTTSIGKVVKVENGQVTIDSQEAAKLSNRGLFNKLMVELDVVFARLGITSDEAKKRLARLLVHEMHSLKSRGFATQSFVINFIVAAHNSRLRQKKTNAINAVEAEYRSFNA